MDKTKTEPFTTLQPTWAALETGHKQNLKPQTKPLPPGGFEHIEWRTGAVLILCYRWQEEWWVVLTRRSENLRNHKGQISLPGGHVEPDEAEADAALREAAEEIGIVPERVTLLNVLPHVYVPPSRYVVTPFVGVIQERPVFTPNSAEVAEVIEVPLRALLLKGAYSEEERLFEGKPRRFSVYRYNDYEIWGATAYILKQFLLSLNENLLEN